MQRRDFFRFLTDSMTMLEADVPAAYDALIASLGGVRARLRAGRDARVVWFEGAELRVESRRLPADVDVAFCRRTILDLVDGTTTLEQSILADRLRIRGSVEAVERFYDALCTYVDGALHSARFPALLDEYRMPRHGERSEEAA
jgi:hypothetical protein